MQAEGPATPFYVDDDYPATVTIDGRPLRIRVKKFTLDEYTTFQRKFQRIGITGKKDQVFIEQHRRRDDSRVDWKDGLEPVDHVLARLELEQSEAERDARRLRDDAEEAFAREFLVESVTKFVTVEPGQLYRRQSQAPITAGADLLQAFAARQDVLQELLSVIYVENCLSDDIKKKLKALSDSEPSSTPATPTAAGDRPAPTATPASDSDSAPVDAATAPPQTLSPSGATTH